MGTHGLLIVSAPNQIVPIRFLGKINCGAIWRGRIMVDEAIRILRGRTEELVHATEKAKGANKHLSATVAATVASFLRRFMRQSSERHCAFKLRCKRRFEVH